MPRTFTLAGLMVAVTAICFICGVAANFPGETLVILGFVGFFVPTILGYLILARFSSTRSALFGSMFGGAVFGLLLVPGVIATGGWEALVFNYLIVAVPPFACALLIGFPFVIVDVWTRQK
jgi:hypothetical protein